MTRATAAQRHRVVIAGGGVAGLEALIALHTLAGEYVDLTLLDPGESFTLRALSVQDPFAPAEPRRYDLRRVCDDHGARLLGDTLAAVEPAERHVRTGDGTVLPFDSLLLALGARAAPVYPQAVTFRGTRDAEPLQALLRELEDGTARRVAFVVPPRATWTLPLYELALLTAQRVHALGLDDVELTLVTPEATALAVFGTEASDAVAAELRDAGVELIAGGYTEAITGDALVIHHGGGERELLADRVVALPRLEGPAPQGVPHDPEGFIAVDQHGAVRGAAAIFAAGDGTSFAVKQGGIAAQQADAAAHAIAARAGVDVEPRPFRPVLRGRLLTGAGSRYLHQGLVGGEGDTSRASADALWWPPTKVAAPYLAPYLERLDLADEGFPPAPAPDPDVEVLGTPPRASRLGVADPGGARVAAFTRELPRHRWAPELDEITAERRLASTVVEVHDAGRPAASKERGVLLHALAYDARDDVFEVAVARPRPGGEDVLRHVVDHPSRVLVDSREGILPRAIAVDDDAGNRTLVRLVDDAPFTG